jgi:hypothetical protein
MANYYAKAGGSKPIDAKTLVDERFRLAALKRVGPYKPQ